jgi:uncharacterized membrane protein YphA (DoxX/SURF4 family)
LASLTDTLFSRAVALRVYGVAAIALGSLGLASADFASVWQPVPQGFPGRTGLAYLVAAIFVIAGAALQSLRSARIGASTLTVLYGAGVLLLHVPQIVSKPSVFVEWSGTAEQLALVAGGLLAYGFCAPSRTENTQRLIKVAQYLFAVCLLFFGAAHLVYLKPTAEFVPSWIPPGQLFWAYATAAGHIAAGLAILTGIAARLAMMLLTLMFIAFSVLVHAPNLFADPSHFNWAANAINFALIASAWVVVASYNSRRSQ